MKHTLKILIFYAIVAVLFILLGSFKAESSEVPVQFEIIKVPAPSPFVYSVEDVYTIHKDFDTNTYHINMGFEVVAKQFYLQLIAGLHALKTTDKIILHLNNFGGDMFAGYPISNALKHTKADLTIHIDGPNYSMGAMLACIGDKLPVFKDKDAHLMFHDYTITTSGKGIDVLRYLLNVNRTFKQYLVNNCVVKGILTRRQVTDILKGTDVYVYEEEILRNRK